MIIDFLIALCIFSVLVLVFFLIAKRYKKCPADKVLVVFGAVGKGESIKCIHGGATFVYPLIQSYAYMDLNPIDTEINEIVYDIHNFPIKIEAEISFCINSHPDYIKKAAERLLGLSQLEIKASVMPIIQGQIRVALATFDIIEILSDKEKLVPAIYDAIENEIKKIGLRLNSFNLKNISDKYNVSKVLSKEIEKAISRRQVGNEININEYKKELTKIDDRLKNIEKERTTVLSKKIELFSRLKQ